VNALIKVEGRTGTLDANDSLTFDSWCFDRSCRGRKVKKRFRLRKRGDDGEQQQEHNNYTEQHHLERSIELPCSTRSLRLLVVQRPHYESVVLRESESVTKAGELRLRIRLRDLLARARQTA